jgi:hypothetical protein
MTTPDNHVYATFTPNIGRTQLTAVFPDRAEARNVINDLRAFGLRLDQLSVAMRDPGQQDKLVVDTGLRASDGAISTAFVRSQGGLRGFIAGLRSSVLPNNPSLGAAADSTRGAALPGGMIGALMNMRMSEAGARRQESSYRDGSVLITASVFEDVAEAQVIMQRHGGGMVHGGEQPTAH